MNNIYEIKATPRAIERLVELLISNFQEVKYTKMNEELIEVKIESIDEYEMFLVAISVTLTFEKIDDVLSELEQKEEVDRESLNGYISEIIRGDTYYAIMTSIPVREFFKTKSNLNITSFLKFNMKGFKEEILNIIELYNDYNDSESIYNKLGVPAENEDNISVVDVFDSIRDTLEEQNFEFEPYYSLFISEKNGYQVVNADGKVIDKEFFRDVANLEIKVVSESMANEKFVNFVAVVNFAVLLFMPEEIIIEGSILPLERKMLEENIMAQARVLEIEVDIK